MLQKVYKSLKIFEDFHLQTIWHLQVLKILGLKTKYGYLKYDNNDKFKMMPTSNKLNLFLTDIV